MPRPNREREITAAIREHLKDAKRGTEPITDKSVMAAVNCSRATFYKYFKEGSKIRREIEAARLKQKERSGRPGQRDSKSIIAELRAELEQAKEGNRALLGNYAQLIANLKLKGVPHSILQWAQTNRMIKPRRDVSQSGKSRRKKL